MNAYQSRHVLLLAVAFEGGLIGVAALLGWALGRPSLELIRPSWTALMVGVTATAPLVLVMLWCVRSNWAPMRRLMKEIDQVIAPLFAHSPFVDLIVVAVLAGLGEELLFRGVIQPFLSGFAGTALALLMTSLLFGLLHLVTPTYALIAAIFGLYLGGLMISTGEILVPITAHALYDMVALGLLRERGRRGHLKDQSLGREGDGNDSTDTPQ